MIEVEIKLHCESHQPIMAQLSKMDAVLKTAHHERDIYFNSPERDFAQTDEALRLRQIDERVILTYKGPKRGNKAKSRLEQEVGVESLEKASEIFESLGYQKVETVIKKRRIYTLPENIEVCLDEVEELGCFVEVEILTEQEHVPEAEDTLQNLIKKLNLSDIEELSYLEQLLKKHGRR